MTWRYDVCPACREVLVTAPADRFTCRQVWIGWHRTHRPPVTVIAGDRASLQAAGYRLVDGRQDRAPEATP